MLFVKTEHGSSSWDYGGERPRLWTAYDIQDVTANESVDIVGDGEKRKRKSENREKKDLKGKYRGDKKQWSFGIKVLWKKK